LFHVLQPYRRVLEKSTDNEYVSSKCVHSSANGASFHGATVELEKLANILDLVFCLTGPYRYLTRRVTFGRLEPPLGRGRIVCDPPKWNPHKYNGQYGPGFISVMTPGDPLPPPSRHIEPPFSVGEVREVVEKPSTLGLQLRSGVSGQ